MSFSLYIRSKILLEMVRSSIIGGHTVSVQQSLEVASLHALQEALRGDPQSSRHSPKL